jgi:CheY-specific phosphatase CheX
LLRDPPGTLALVLASDTAANLAARYLPTGTALSSEIIDDVAGEFANVIAGQAKTILKGTPYRFHLSTPEVKRTSAFRAGLTMATCLFSEIVIAMLFAGFTDRKPGSAVSGR